MSSSTHHVPMVVTFDRETTRILSIQSRDRSPKELVDAATIGFGGVRSELVRATSLPQRTLANFADGTNKGSAALVLLLKILAANPEAARRLCASARQS